MLLKMPLQNMLKRKVLLSTLTVLLILTSFFGCSSTEIKDATFCSPIPNNLGAACDNFLTSNQVILDQKGWEQKQNEWLSNGYAIECTTSQTFGDFKSEIEKLCSKVQCDYNAQKVIVGALEKLQALGKPKSKEAILDE